MEEYKNELLDEWVGKVVLVKRLWGPELDEDLAEKIVENPLTSRSEALQSYTHACKLRGYDRLGLVLELAQSDPETNFVPWGAVLELSYLTEEFRAGRPEAAS